MVEFKFDPVAVLNELKEFDRATWELVHERYRRKQYEAELERLTAAPPGESPDEEEGNER